MRYLFLPGADLALESIVIEGPDAHHLLNVLRIRAGESLTLLDNGGHACLAQVAELGKRSVIVRVCGAAECPPDPAVHVTVAQALGKGDKFEQVIQHATEVGASAFIPLLTERTVVKLDPRDSEAKLASWSQIAKGAAEQSGRARIPLIHPPTALRDLCARFFEFGRVLLLHPGTADRETGRQGDRETGRQGDKGTTGQRDEDNALESSDSVIEHDLVVGGGPFSPCLVLVGPEGGFSDTELAAAEAAGAVRTSLGPFTLRTETAALVAVSRILYEAERG